MRISHQLVVSSFHKFGVCDIGVASEYLVESKVDLLHKANAVILYFWSAISNGLRRRKIWQIPSAFGLRHN